MTKSLNKLTPKQSKALSFIKRSISQSGNAPTLRELCSYMGYSAIGSAQDMVAALRKKGYLSTPEKQSARSLTLTKVSKELNSADLFDGNTYLVPCLGEVPAGNPLEAIEDKVATLRISVSMFKRPHPKPDQLFSVQAKGDSMLDAGILSGDWLVVKAQKEASPGTIVVARVDGDATVKRLMKDQKGWYLKPENEAFSPIRPEPGQSFEIVGSVVALQRLLN